MNYKETLDKDFNEHLANVASELGFKVYEQYSDETGGALIKLKNGQLRIELINDRGIVNLNIGPLTGKENFIDAELINSYLTLQEQESEQLTKWSRKKIVNKRIGLAEQVNLLTAKRTNLEHIFNKKQLKKTIKDLQQLGEERFNNML